MTRGQSVFLKESAKDQAPGLTRTSSYSGTVGAKKTLKKTRTLPGDEAERMLSPSPSSSPTYTHIPNSGQNSPTIMSPIVAPWIAVDLSDVRARDVVAEALSQKRWQSLGLEPLSIGSRSPAAEMRTVSGGSEGRITPGSTKSTDEGYFATRGRGRNQDSKKRGDLKITTTEDGTTKDRRNDASEGVISTTNESDRPTTQERRSRSLRPSPPEIRLTDEPVEADLAQQMFRRADRAPSMNPSSRLRTGLL